MDPPAKKQKTDAEEKEKTPWKHNPQQKLDVCLTCGLEGHSWTDCINRCDKCSAVHAGGICPLLPALYPRARNEEKDDAASRLKKNADDRERLVHQREQEIAVLTTMEQLVLGRKVPALEAVKPRSNSQKGAALRLLEVETWVELDPGWASRTSQEKDVLRKQWNDEALGNLPCAQSSLLFRAMVTRKGGFRTLSQ
jgi:hypothetical protein